MNSQSFLVQAWSCVCQNLNNSAFYIEEQILWCRFFCPSLFKMSVCVVTQLWNCSTFAKKKFAFPSFSLSALSELWKFLLMLRLYLVATQMHNVRRRLRDYFMLQQFALANQILAEEMSS